MGEITQAKLILDLELSLDKMEERQRLPWVSDLDTTIRP